MKVLVIGGGGREHAIGHCLSKDKRIKKLFFAPGNAGTAQLGENVSIKVDEVDRLLEFALAEKIDLTVVGPELPLTLGISDKFAAKNLRIFGANRLAARLEGSKAFAKDFMARHNLPTAAYNIFSDVNSALEGLKQFSFPAVIKADGIAAGKGVIICESHKQAEEELNAILVGGKFGGAGSKVVIEEFLRGREASLLCFCDGKTLVPMPSAQDYKRALDGDLGLNTGGMGAISPADCYTDKHKRLFEGEILPKTLAALHAEGIDFRGVLYFGLMIDGGRINILEFNVRFGDPETEALLLRLKTPLADIFNAVIDGNLAAQKIEWDERPAACVVIASGGYPESYRTGLPVEIPKTVGDSGVQIFHAGTALSADKTVTAGGRVLVVGNVQASLSGALEQIYGVCGGIKFDGMFYRRDIGQKK